MSFFNSLNKQLKKNRILPLNSCHLYFTCILECVNDFSQWLIGKKCANKVYLTEDRAKCVFSTRTCREY